MCADPAVLPDRVTPAERLGLAYRPGPGSPRLGRPGLLPAQEAVRRQLFEYDRRAHPRRRKGDEALIFLRKQAD